MADDVVADVAVNRDARQRDIDFLHRAVKDGAVRFRVDAAARDVRIAGAARAREEVALDMLEAVVLLRELVPDILLDAQAVVHREEMKGIALRMMTELCEIAAVEQAHHFLIGIEQAIGGLFLCDVEAAGQIRGDAGKGMYVRICIGMIGFCHKNTSFQSRSSSIF